jgi:hypothetical protein
MEWMYKGPGQSSADKEEYLLGKAVDKTFEESHRLGGAIVDATPAPLLGRETVARSNASQVDIARKVNEDPLVKIKLAEREKLKKARDKFIAHNVGKNKVELVPRGASAAASSEDNDSLDAILARKLEAFVAATRIKVGDDDDVGLLHDVIKKAFKCVHVTLILLSWKGTITLIHKSRIFDQTFGFILEGNSSYQNIFFTS